MILARHRRVGVRPGRPATKRRSSAGRRAAATRTIDDVRVVSIAAECEPWIKVGGLADVVGALARALPAVGGLSAPVDVYLPRYREVVVPPGATAGPRFSVPDPLAPSGSSEARLVDAPVDGYRLRLVDIPAAFDRDGVYGDGSGDHPDNAWRFGLLGAAALEAIRREGQPIDVLHLHDWHAAPVTIGRDRAAPDDPLVRRAATVLTLHNLAYHGWVPRDRLDQLGLSPGDGVVPTGADGIELLRAGIERADVVNAVGPTFAAEARTPAGGFGLDDVLRAKGDRFTGILNGLDTTVWDPATDPAIAARYDRADPTGKRACRAALLEELGLDPADDGIVLGAVGRLDPQKGFDLLARAIPELAAAGARIVALGAGQAKLSAALRRAARRDARSVVFVDGFDRALARRLYAGADALLIPSRFEPCGLVQMIALRYGTPPVAHATGGLVDTIVDATERPAEGTGFLFEQPTAIGLVEACRRAMALRGDGSSDAWLALVERGMAADFAWASRAAPAYRSLYEQAVAIRRATAVRADPDPALPPTRGAGRDERTRRSKGSDRSVQSRDGDPPVRT